jgi:hypothetical protein
MPETISLEEQIKAAQRELALRKKVYPGFVARGSMTQDEADYQIACATAWIVTLTRCLEQEQAQHQLALFGADHGDNPRHHL